MRRSKVLAVTIAVREPKDSYFITGEQEALHMNNECPSIMHMFFEDILLQGDPKHEGVPRPHSASCPTCLVRGAPPACPTRPSRDARRASCQTRRTCLTRGARGAFLPFSEKTCFFWERGSGVGAVNVSTNGLSETPSHRFRKCCATPQEEIQPKLHTAAEAWCGGTKNNASHLVTSQDRILCKHQLTT